MNRDLNTCSPPSIDSKTDSKVDEKQWCSVIRDGHVAGILSTARTWADTSAHTLCNPVCATEHAHEDAPSQIRSCLRRFYFWGICLCTATVQQRNILSWRLPHTDIRSSFDDDSSDQTLFAWNWDALLHEKSYPRVGFSLLFSQCIGSPHHRSPLLSDAF